MTKLIIIDAPDGAGKTTIAKMLVKKRNYVELRLPDYGTTIGRIIKEWNSKNKRGISEDDYQRLMKENYLEVFHKIKKLTKAGKNIVMTRFTPSMKVYSEINGADQVLIDSFIREIDVMYKGLNIVKAMLDISAEEAEEMISTREQKRENLFESKEMVKKVNAGYKKYAIENKDWTVIKRDTVEKVYSQLIRIK